MQRLVRDDEEVVWQATPDPAAFCAGWVLGLGVTAGVLATFAGVVGLFEHGTDLASVVASYLADWAPELAMDTALLLPAGALGLRRAHAMAEFVVTDDRILQAGGLIGRDVSVVSLSNVTDVDVTRSLAGKLFGAGTLSFQTAGSSRFGVRLRAIEDPEGVLGLVEALQGSRAAGPERTAQSGQIA